MRRATLTTLGALAWLAATSKAMAAVPLAAGNGEISFWPTLLKTLGALALLIGLMLLAAGLAKRLGGRGMGGSGASLINIVQSKILGPKKQITVVEVAGAYLVLGVTDQQINLLARLEELPQGAARQSSWPAAKGKQPHGFAAVLDRIRKLERSTG